jgi:hypothetical protein
MATLKYALLALLVGCGDLQGFGGPVPPLASIHVAAPAGAQGDLHVALLWGQQWLTEPLCILPAENENAAAVIATGCRDPFGFVPDRVGGDVAIAAGDETTIDLPDLPSADVMVGDITARIAYASLVLYDDRDHSGALDLGSVRRPGDNPDDSTTDQVVGASFVSMTAPDRRLAYREGGFNEAAAFYPRHGCPDPAPAFSIVDAGGFTAEAAIAATLAGQLPDEDPSTCAGAALPDTTVSIAVAPDPSTVAEAGCTERRDDSSIRFREPPDDAPDFADRTTACIHLAAFDMPPPSDVIQLVVSGRSMDRCKSVTHYVLKGCREDALCGAPDWDHSAAPPAWWPC